jgi:Ca-activated chloride channel family protein
MQLNAHMDVELVAVEQDDEVTVMLELAAPLEARPKPRPPATVEVVLDRSGSMAGERLDAARAALAALVERLDPADRLGVVAFDGGVDVVLPAGPVADKPASKAAVLGIEPGGTTNLSGGLLRGIQEARRVAGDAGATLLLLSDGHANEGVTDPERLAATAEKARSCGVTVCTIGVGLDYDERLLAAVAAGGQGGHIFAETGEDAVAAVAGEVEGLLSKTVQAASLVIRPTASSEQFTIWNDLPAQGIGDGVMVELGDFWAGEQRALLLSFAVPAMPSLGVAEIATLELRYVAVPELVEETITLPLHVNVVPGDQAAGRVPLPKVRSELLFQRAQQAKRRAADAIAEGDVAAAGQLYLDARQALTSAPGEALTDDLLAEAKILSELGDRLAKGEDRWAAKRSRMEHARKMRLRGRREPGL